MNILPVANRPVKLDGQPPPINSHFPAGPIGFDVLVGLLKGKNKADAPCPECGPRCTTKGNAKKPVLRVWRKDEGFLTYACARCGAKGYAADRTRDWRKRIPPDLPKRTLPIVVPHYDDPEQREKIAYGLSVFEASVPLKRTVADTYLRSRGLKIGEDLSHFLRFHPGLPHSSGKTPAMVALLRDIHTDVPTGIHRTYLTPDARKIERRMLGRARGAAIKIDAHEDVVSGLHIGEGIETCLAARHVDFRPTWALGCASAIAGFPVIAGIEALAVFGENDGASTNAACEVCARYEAQGCETFLYLPPRGDFNDTLKEAV
jgi:hypothetical protein